MNGPRNLNAPFFVVWRTSLFTSSMIILTGIFFCFGGIFIFVGLFAAGPPLESAGWAGFGMLVSALSVVSFLHLMLQRPKYEFYESYFKITHGRRFNCEIKYSEIEHVRLYPFSWVRYFNLSYLPSLFQPRIVITAYHDFEEKSYLIFDNPLNKQFGIHLYDWLKEKADKC